MRARGKIAYFGLSMISPRTKEQILTFARIEEVIGQFVNLKRRGSNWVGLCPFHAEKTPSFHVSAERGIFKCFGCGKSGDVITFLTEHERMSFTDALRWLAERYHIDVEELSSPKADRRETESLFIVMEFARKHYQHNLMETTEGTTLGLAYFRERGISDDLIRRFQLGYACRGGRDLLLAAEREKYDLGRLQQLGLISEKSGHDFFQERIIFPIHNLSGKPVAFAGRVMKGSQQTAKYINSPESELYRKSQHLYGLYQAREAIRRHNECFLTEGYMDVLAMHLAGMEHAVASSGTALTEEQVRLLKRFTDNVTLLFDGDRAGVQAALRGLELLLRNDLNVRAVMLPQGHDPHSYWQQFGSDALQQYIATNRQDIISFMASVLFDEAGNDPLKKGEAVRQIVTTLASVMDGIKRGMLIKACSSRFELNEAMLNHEVNKIMLRAMGKKSGISAPFAAEPPVPHKASAQELQRLHVLEKELLRLLLVYGDKPMTDSHTVADVISEALREVTLQHEECRLLFQVIVAGREAGSAWAPSDLIHHEVPEIRELVMELMASPHELSKNWDHRHGISVQHPEHNYADEVNAVICHYEMQLLRIYERQNLSDLQHAASHEQREHYMRVQQNILERKRLLASKRGTVILG